MQAELTTADWDKYNQDHLATGSATGIIHLWDLRNTKYPLDGIDGELNMVCTVSSALDLSNETLLVLAAHRYSVRKVRYSPWRPGNLASTSYDMSVGIWNTYGSVASDKKSSLLMRLQHHSEFTQGVGWSCFRRDILCTCGWDHKVILWNLCRFIPTRC